MQQMVLYVRKIELRESLAHDIKQVASVGKNYLYPVRRVKIATYQKGPTVVDFFQTDILPGEEELPRHIFIALVHHEAVQGVLHHGSLQLPAFRCKESWAVLEGGHHVSYPAQNPVLSIFQTI